jgi:hypothetical protein
MYFFSPCDQVGECRVALQGSAYPVPTLYLPCTYPVPQRLQSAKSSSAPVLAIWPWRTPTGPCADERKPRQTSCWVVLGSFCVELQGMAYPIPQMFCLICSQPVHFGAVRFAHRLPDCAGMALCEDRASRHGSRIAWPDSNRRLPTQ